MSVKIRNLPYGAFIKKIVTIASQLAKEHPNKIPLFFERFTTLVEETKDIQTGFSIIPIKGEYVVVLGVLYAKEDDLIAIAHDFGIKNLKFFSQMDKLSGLEDSVKSTRCIGVVIGGTPHSLPENIEKEYKEKFFVAINGNKRKINQLSFKESLQKLMFERTRKHLQVSSIKK